MAKLYVLDLATIICGTSTTTTIVNPDPFGVGPIAQDTHADNHNSDAGTEIGNRKPPVASCYDACVQAKRDGKLL